MKTKDVNKTGYYWLRRRPQAQVEMVRVYAEQAFGNESLWLETWIGQRKESVVAVGGVTPDAEWAGPLDPQAAFKK